MFGFVDYMDQWGVKDNNSNIIIRWSDVVISVHTCVGKGGGQDAPKGNVTSHPQCV